ncbi:hypothetical protein HELRODRAFT_178131 [Helobdella robusta]|uniref:WSC domain-containing protein n=1 Tax=Helobdella robusta TaxID=6412 RepID=T1FCT1_HELRO|nr:hypothetical protein HELRODRAFT_178131 [Helobdella robusta]ESN97345.1 hypothetical protein HELRODRAFT_178131 [Helobdella robusta]
MKITFLPNKNSYGLKTCAIDNPDVQHSFGYDSHLKCIALCSTVNSCVGCSYQLDQKLCSLFLDRTKLTTKYEVSENCVLYQLVNRINEPRHELGGVLDLFVTSRSFPIVNSLIFPTGVLSDHGLIQREKTILKTKFDDVSAHYVGCYIDEASRDLIHQEPNDVSLTVEKCWKICGDLKYTVFALQNSDQCFCSHSHGKYGMDSGCVARCKGSADEICGGYWRNSLYTVCDNAMYGQNCNVKCPCAPTCVCHRLTGDTV